MFEKRELMKLVRELKKAKAIPRNARIEYESVGDDKYRVFKIHAARKVTILVEPVPPLKRLSAFLKRILPDIYNEIKQFPSDLLARVSIFPRIYSGVYVVIYASKIRSFQISDGMEIQWHFVNQDAVFFTRFGVLHKKDIFALFEKKRYVEQLLDQFEKEKAEWLDAIKNVKAIGIYEI